MYREELDCMKTAIAAEQKKRDTLKNLDCFVLDNSIRESIVGQLRGHTLENNWKICNQVKKCGFKNIIVAAFSHMTRVDDTFIQELKQQNEDPNSLFAFTEVTAGITEGVVDTDTIPVGLAKMKEHGLINPIIEFDLADKSINWELWPVENMHQLIEKWIEWSRANLSKDAKIFVNFRDLPVAMIQVPEHVLATVNYIASLPPEKRPMGIIYEEPTGNYLPEDVSAWTATVRRMMIAKN